MATHLYGFTLDPGEDTKGAIQRGIDLVNQKVVNAGEVADWTTLQVVSRQLSTGLAVLPTVTLMGVMVTASAPDPG